MAHPLIDFHVYLFYFFKVKDAVRDYLPPDEPATRKNPLYRNLFDGFDRIDGKPTEAERKVWIFVEELWMLCYSVSNQNMFAVAIFYGSEGWKVMARVDHVLEPYLLLLALETH